MWEYLNELGYDSHPDLEAMFEPNAFDGCMTPHFRSEPSHEDWNRNNWARFVRLSGVPDELVESMTSRLLAVLDGFQAKTVRRATAVLELLRRNGMKVGLCSNWERPIGPYLEAAGLPAFDAVSVSAEVGARKPHSLIFRDVCTKLDVKPEEAVFVGDTWSTDVVGALRSGLAPVWIRGRRPSRGLGHVVAEFETVGELECHLRRCLCDE